MARSRLVQGSFKVSCLAFALVLMTCSPIIDSEFASVISIEESYCDSMLEALRFEESQSRSSTERKAVGMSEYFEGLTIVDTSGSPISFSSFNLEERAVFLDAWKKENSARLKALTESNEAIKRELRAADKAMNAALAAIKSGAPGDFISIYATELERSVTEEKAKGSAERVSARGGVAPVSMSGVGAMRAYYGTGRIACTNATYSSASSLWSFGHTSLCENSAWNRDWENAAANHLINVGAWGDTNFSQVGYTQAGVGRESANYWLNKVSEVSNSRFSLHQAVDAV